MLNINEVNTLKDSLLESIKQQVLTICYKRCTLNIMAERLKINGWKKTDHANSKHKMVRVIILSHKICGNTTVLPKIKRDIL